MLSKKIKAFWGVFALLVLVEPSFGRVCTQNLSEEKAFDFVEFLIESDMGLEEKKAALKDSCKEFSRFKRRNTHIEKKIWSKTHKLLSPVIGFLQQGLSSYTILGNSEIEKAFKEELEEIKTIPSPLLRIQASYELALKFQGEYEYDEKGDPKGGGIFSSPKTLIKDADKFGAAGVCRDFSELLYWILLQVQRVSVESAEEDNFFSMNMMRNAGEGMDRSGHAWIRINMPKRDEQRQLYFKRFDLDSTWYTKRFSPLSLRFQGWSDDKLDKLYQDCRKIELKSCSEGAD